MSHIWVDFRGIADAYMREKKSDYFENSRRATMVQQQYGVTNPLGLQHRSELCWACRRATGPGRRRRRLPASSASSSTISRAARPLVPTTARVGWVSRYHFGIDEGPTVLMIENYRSDLIWTLMRQCAALVPGLRAAGFSGWLDESAPVRN